MIDETRRAGGCAPDTCPNVTCPHHDVHAEGGCCAPTAADMARVKCPQMSDGERRAALAERSDMTDGVIVEAMERPAGPMHFSGGGAVDDGVRVVHALSGWPVCCCGEHAESIRRDGNHTDNPFRVTCLVCADVMSDARDGFVAQVGSLLREHLPKLGLRDVTAETEG